MATPRRPHSPNVSPPGSFKFGLQRSSGKVVSPGVTQGQMQFRTTPTEHAKLSQAEFRLGVDEYDPAEDVPEDEVKVVEVERSAKGSRRLSTWLNRMGLRGD